MKELKNVRSETKNYIAFLDLPFVTRPFVNKILLFSVFICFWASKPTCG